MPNNNRTRRQAANSRGMTLVEMLTAMGVIAVLIAMLALGIKYVRAKAQTDRTRTMLQNLRAMYTEFEAKGGRMAMLDDPFQKRSGGWKVVKRYPVPDGVLDEDGHFLIKNGQRAAFIGDPDNTNDDHHAIKQMIRIVKALQTMPANKKIAESWSQDVAVKVRDPSTAGHIVLPTDGWGNPILYGPRNAPPVPADPSVAPSGPAPTPDKLVWGIDGLTVKDQKDFFFYQPADGKGVFFSAGPDGDYSTTDDNVYSDDSGKTVTGKMN